MEDSSSRGVVPQSSELIQEYAAGRDQFEDIGTKIESLSLSEKTIEGEADNSDTLEESEQKVVDEIESLCMGCHENVCTTHSQTL